MTAMILKGKDADWEIVCGLEIHCQIISKSKIYSGASTQYGSDVNENVSFVDAGMPGMLPVLNEECVHQAVKTGLALNCHINKHSAFARKNYFYADLPQGYQITQDKFPLVGEGKVEITLEDGSKKEIGIERIHIEQDAAKSIHDISPTKTFIDFNRCGVGLMEIVTKPDFRSPENDLRPRAEMKNVNSVKFAMQAIEYEAKRQLDLYDNGEVMEQQTRKFDAVRGITEFLRKKEFADDYRYFPEPDLLPLELSDEYINKVKSEMPELPDEKKKRFVEKLGLTPYDAEVICEDKETAAFFEAAAQGHDAKKVANWLMGDFFAMLNEKKLSLADSPISAKNLGALVELVSQNVINGKTAKDVFVLMAQTGDAPEKIVEEKGLKQVTDTSAIEKIVDDILSSSPDNVAAYKAGKVNLMGWFVGQVMKASSGKANPAVVNQLLKQKLG